ncbi:glycoside hydrolase family 38 C-terminal domain-containing protein [Rugosimonospora africana]|uniref:Alpha-mannosidase n=1 Tax=Rugosimonospora africana TaxID=556532 RepID=A0A8J3VPK2_9ACTN|nr:glycoside hydrolase family 38 C-terminal domain-containing protein [Rugosimonospora africana]GIH14199.1 alpha-mannosidase [Rugosimonospora africana]
MTSRLLRASLGSPGYDDMRATLRAAGATTVIDSPQATVTAAALPLFRDGSGGLEQAVRVTSTVPVTVALRVGESTVDRATVTDRADLWMPEVDSPIDVTVEVEGHGQGTVRVAPQRKWTVHVVHHSHLDIGYTDRQGVVLRNHLDYLDSAVELAAETDDWPDDSRFRWTVESALPVRHFLDARPADAVGEFTRLVKAGRIEVTAMPFQLHTEACSVDELHRMLRFTDDLRERYDIPVTSAMHTDVPGAVVGFVDALAASGVRYLSAAHNWAGRSVPFLTGGQELGRPFWWRSPAGNRVLVWFTDTPHGMAYMEGNVVGLGESFDAAQGLLPGYLLRVAEHAVPYGREAFGWSGLPDDRLTKTPYPWDVLHLRVQGGNADNAGPSLMPPSVVRAWNERYAYPRLRMSTNTEFFVEAEQRFGDRLAEHCGDWTDWWADGLGSGARPLGYARRAQNALRHAETLHTLAGAPSGVDGTYDKLGLFDEHTWGAANPWHDHEDGFDSGGMQWARKCELAYSAADDAEDLRRAGAHRLGAEHGRPDGALAAYLVANLGPADRTDVVEAFLPASTVPLDTHVSIVDARTGDAVPHHEHLERPEEWPTRPAGRRLWFVAADVPAVGQARFDIVAADVPSPEPVELAAWQVENEFYRVVVDPTDGAISSLFDKRAGRELVNAGGYARMNQYVYERYSTAPHINHLSGHISAGTDPEHADLSLLASRAVGRRPTLLRAHRTPVGETLEIELSGDGVDWLRTTISLYRGVPRVDVTNRLYKQGAPAKESIFFAFPLATGAPAAWELTGGVGGPDAAVVPGAARHLTPVRHWVGFDDGELAVAWATLEAPLVMFGDLYLPYAPFPPTLRPQPAEPGTVYSWAMNNIWDTNFPAQQQGETTFRYAIASEPAGDPAILGPATAASFTDPLLAVPVSGQGDPPAATERFATVDHPLVRVVALGASRRGHDLVAYLASVAGSAVDTRLSVPGMRAAQVGTSLERDQRPLEVRDGETVVSVPANGFIAVSIDRVTR